MAFVPASVVSATRPSPPRTLGRFVLRQLLGKSERTMAWLVTDPQTQREEMLWLPRVQPGDAAALDAWLAAARRAARLDHPRLVPVAEVGVAAHWPYVCVDRSAGLTLGEWLASRPAPSPVDAATWIAELLDGLAFVHEAGQVHGDLQPHTLIVDADGGLRLGALAVAQEGPPPVLPAGATFDADLLRQRRDGAQRDLLCAGLLLHGLVAGAPALGEADLGVAVDRLAPRGRDAVRLPWTTPHPVPEALRVITDRATTSTESLRYLGARSLLRALNGWRTAHAEERGGALALLLDRLQSVGHLPAMPGAMARVGQLIAAADARRTDELAASIVDDMAWSLELLRTVNAAQVQATQAAGSAAVLTIRRAIALLGLDGVRRAANALRVWPGPLDEASADALCRAMHRVRWAAVTAQVLRPAGYDAEVVYLVAMLQNLGRLLVQYHFPQEAQQIRALMQPVPPPPDAEPGTPSRPGLDEAAAANAVLGVDAEAIGAAVARHWGLGEEIQQMIRRVSTARPVRSAETDAEAIRIAASAANEAVDAAGLAPPARAALALDAVAQRYARALKIDTKGLREALQAARSTLQAGAPLAAPSTVEAS